MKTFKLLFTSLLSLVLFSSSLLAKNSDEQSDSLTTHAAAAVSGFVGGRSYQELVLLPSLVWRLFKVSLIQKSHTQL